MSDQSLSEQLAKRIRQHRFNIEAEECAINEIARKHIPDFHFLDFKVSTFWNCADSPIGMCVFFVSERGRLGSCRYCGGPVERK